MNYFLSRNYRTLNQAGNKAKTDIEAALTELGFRSAGLAQSTHKNAVLHFLYNIGSVLKAPFTLRKGDILVIQYPLKKWFALSCKLAHLRGARVITVIHDLGSFRRKALTIPQEIARLSNADYIIAHNAKMRQWLEEHGLQRPIGELGIFDYRSTTEAQPATEVKRPYRLLYAGALAPIKNAFLYEIGAHIHNYRFNLYGNGFKVEEAKGSEHFNYIGFVPSDQLIATAQGDFGLVWDGHSLDGCMGDLGEYLQYNNPHKTSLYLRCGLPIIIWKRAALASFVEEHQVGLTIDSLRELDERLGSLSEEEYYAMRQRVATVSQRIAEGRYVQEAVKQAMETLKD
ncbi:MAG: galactofuranosyltransferase [Alistipes sp.]|nr:galactofuranosyltransferase [Alistipes sp.]